MSIVRSLNELQNQIKEGPCVTIGNFDGVHAGHRALIKKLNQKARQKKLKSVIVTFYPHPLSIVSGKTPPFITPIQEKLEVIQELGPDFIFCLQFNEQIAELSPEEFVSIYLVNGLNAKELIIGHDYTFGKDRKGNFELLQKLGREHGFNVEKMPAVNKNSAVVSSTRIRELIQEGKVWEVSPLLERFYQIRGKVVQGQKRGGPLLGIPTANLELSDELVPKPGVYAVWAKFEDKKYPAVANVGHVPTFDQESLSIEVHILDFEQNIYEQELRVDFVCRLRDEQKFSGIEGLLAQIHADIEQARDILDPE